jgi:hypothetical protein
MPFVIDEDIGNVPAGVAFGDRCPIAHITYVKFR